MNRILTRINQRVFRLRSPLLIAVFSFVLFGFGISFFHPPFLADDYWLLWLHLSKPGFGWTEPYVFSRMPVATLLAVGTVKSEILEKFPRLFLTGMFAVHAFAFALLLKTLFDGSQKGSIRFGVPLIVSSLLFAFQPNNYEIHLWHLLALHSFGALLIALAFRTKNWVTQIALSVMGLLTYDTFPLLLLGFSALWIVLSPERPFDRARIKKQSLILFLSGILWVFTKWILKSWTGYLHVPPFESDIHALILNIKFVFRTLWEIHFYKTNWPLTVMNWSAIGILGLLTLRRKLLSTRRLLLLLSIPTVVALPLALNTYPAPRAYYGPQILQGLVFCSLLTQLLAQKGFRNRANQLVIALFFFTSFGGWANTLRIKEANAVKLWEKEAQILQAIKECESPCALNVPNPAVGLNRDYVLPQFVWHYYYDRLRLKSYPSKQIQFNIIEN